MTVRPQPLLIILGPTATGKSDLALAVAEKLHSEMISGDSMQVYQGMDIGTAKTPEQERRGIPHHLLDIVTPQTAFSVADFRSLALKAIGDISNRGHLPLLVGGTGLYIDSLLYPYHFPENSGAEPGLRQRLQEDYRELGGETLHSRLAAVDPEAAARIHPHDSRRLIRAMEVFESSGQPISALQKVKKPIAGLRPLIAGLCLERQQLYQHIDQRVERMVSAGLIEEVENLLAAGVPREGVSMQGIGYRQIAAYLAGEMGREEAIALIKRDTRRFAKRQMTWFKRNPMIHWFDIGHYREEGSLEQAVCAWFAGQLEEECV